MQKRCQKCRKKVSEDLFICPHCGAIFGGPIYEPPKQKTLKANEEKNAQPKKQKKWFIAIPIAIAVVLMVLLLLGPFSADEDGATAPYGSSALLESSSGSISTIPESIFSVTIVDRAGNPLQGIDVTLRYADITVTTNENGVASFVVPELMASNNWFVSLSNVPADFYYLSEYSFPLSEKSQLITLYYLEGDPLPNYIEYTVKVVDENNDPVKDVAVRFEPISPLSSAVNDDVTAITDSSGEVKVEIYEGSSVYVTLLFVPNGYSNVTVNQILHFAKGSQEMTIVLTKEELGSSYYMFRLIDQYGDPVAFADVCIELPDLGYQCNGMTNMEGCFWAMITVDDCCAIIKKLPDPYSFQALGERLYFGENRNMTIVVQHNDIIILE